MGLGIFMWWTVTCYLMIKIHSILLSVNLSPHTSFLLLKLNKLHPGSGSVLVRETEDSLTFAFMETLGAGRQV